MTLNVAKLMNNVHCDPVNGLLFWKQTGAGRKMGVPLGHLRIDQKGNPIREVQFDGITYQTKFLIYVLCTKRIPAGRIIGHFDGDQDNMSFRNLYDVSLMTKIESLVA